MESRSVVSDLNAGESVIEACRNGDREALRVIFDLYKDRVYSLALQFFHGDEAAAMDASQQVFLKLASGGLNGFRGDANFSTWLYRMIVNTCIDQHRRRKPQVEVSDILPDRRPSGEETYFRGEVDGAVRTALAGLNPKLRLALLLRYFEDLSYEEMAAVLKCSKGTVASRLNRGHQALARKLAHLRGAFGRGI